MGKKSRARVAVAGTRKDPDRVVVENGKTEDADKKVGAHAHPEWMVSAKLRIIIPS